MTPRAPLLTAEMCSEIACDNSTESGRAAYWAVRAIEDGRTTCVRVMSEDECRAEFEAWYFLHAWKLPTPAEIWLACARANGLVKP